MLVDIDEWLIIATEKLQKTFFDRLLFVGLQGSYNRGEATDTSDIDLIVVLDVLSFEDLKIYRSIIDSMPNKDKACGFISGKNELQNWSKADMFQFFYDTKPLFGKLSDIIQPPTKDEIKQAVKIGSENLYHSAVHSYVHSDDYGRDLQMLYKMAFYILQAKHFVETNNYAKTKNELLGYLKETDYEILNICMNRKKIALADNHRFENLYKKLIGWCSANI